MQMIYFSPHLSSLFSNSHPAAFLPILMPFNLIFSQLSFMQDFRLLRETKEKRKEFLSRNFWKTVIKVKMLLC